MFTVHSETIKQKSYYADSIERSINTVLADSGYQKKISLPDDLYPITTTIEPDLIDSTIPFFIKTKQGCKEVTLKNSNENEIFYGTLSVKDTSNKTVHYKTCSHPLVTTTTYSFFFSLLEPLSIPNGKSGQLTCTEECFETGFGEGCGSPPDLYDALVAIDTTGFHFAYGATPFTLKLLPNGLDTAEIYYGDQLLQSRFTKGILIRKNGIGYNQYLSSLPNGLKSSMRFPNTERVGNLIENSNDLPKRIQALIGENRKIPVMIYDTTIDYMHVVNEELSDIHFRNSDQYERSYSIYREQCQCEGDSLGGSFPGFY